MALKLKGSTSGFVGLDAPAVSGNNTLILPENSGSAFQLFANDITAGVTTFTSVSVNRNGDLTVPGTISIGGTLTYEDVTSVDSVGIVTARGLSIFGNTTGLNASGIGTFFGSTGNVRVELHSTASGTGSQIKLHNDHGTAYFGQAGDTTGDLLVYNESNTNIKFFTNGNNERLSITSAGLVSIPISGSLQVGAAGSGETDTKVYVANTGGNAYIQLKGADSSGTVGLKFGRNSVANRAGIDWSASTDALSFRTGGTGEKLRITSTGTVLKGLTTARANFANNTSGVEYGFQIEGTTGITAGLTIIRNSNDANDGGIVLGKTRATSTGGNTVVQAGDDLGNIAFAGSDGTSLQLGAEIFAEVQTGVGNDDLPTDLIFKTNAGSTSTTERLRIHADGEVECKGGGAGQNALLVTGNYSASNNVDIQTWQRIGGAVQAKMIYKDATTDLHFGSHTAHAFSLMTGGTDKLTIPSAGGITVQQGDAHYPTIFQGGGSGGRNYVTVKAGNTSSGSYSGFNIQDSSGNHLWQFGVEHNNDDLDIFGNSAGGRLRFWTKDTGASSSTIKMQLTQGGLLDAKPQKGNTSGSAYNMIPRGRAYEWSAPNLSPSIGGSSSGWYPIMDVNDGIYMFWIGTSAHNSALVTVSNGYDPSAKSTINCLHYCYNPNGSYLNIEKVRVLNNGVVEVYLYAGSPAYFAMYIQMMSNNDHPNFYTTLTKNTGSPTVDHELDIKATGSSYNGMMQVKHLKVEEKFLMGTTGSIDMGFGPQVLTVRGGNTAGYDGTAAAVFGQTDSDASCVLIYGSDTSYGSNLIDVRVARGGSSSYNFAVYRSGGNADNEFIFRGDGNAFQDGGTTFSTPADYAEYFEWSDGNSANEDRRGMTVVLDGNKVKVATSSDSTDNIIGVVSGNPAVVGDGAWNKWAEKYLKDDFNNYILDSDGNRQLNSSYDSTKVYTPRAERQEWDAIGMVGKLRIRKGQQTGTRWIKMRDISDTVEEWLVR